MMAGPPLCFKRSAADEEADGSAPDDCNDAGELATLALEACWPMAWLKSRSVTAEELMMEAVFVPV